jgi:hypothetical protein
MGELDAGDRDGRVRKRLEPGHRGAASLDGAMVLLDEVVEILVRPDLHVTPAGALASHQPQRSPTWQMAIERDLPRDTWESRGESLAKEGLRDRYAAIAAKQKVDGLAGLSTAL